MIPERIIAFNRARGHAPAANAVIHFYIADAFFECVWNNPTTYLPMLQRFPFVISTDYSLYSDMLLPEVMWNTFRNKLLCAWWQKNGVNVIPNVSWSRGRPRSVSQEADSVPDRFLLSRTKDLG